jgi:transposase
VFVRTSRRRYKGQTYTNYVLVESVRTAKGPRQKVVCSLGDLSPRPRAQWLELARKVGAALGGQPELLAADDAEVAEVVERVRRGRPRRERGSAADLISVHADRIRTEAHRTVGPVHVGVQYWRRLGLDEILATIGLSERARILTLAMTMNRLIHPCSEHAMPDWIRRTALADILAVDFRRLRDLALYRQLDRLHPQRAAIEAALAARERTLFNCDNTVLLYDLTSTYFEGQALRIPKATRGYSRDHRPDCKQVVVGLVLNGEGFPLAHEIFAGNMQDRTSLPAMLEQLNARVPLQPGQTVVVDRGMAYEENLAVIRSRQLHYLVAARQPERDRWLAEFEGEGFEEVIRQPSPRNPLQKKPKVEVKLERRGEETYVLCRGAGRVEKDSAIRRKQEQRLRADLDKLARRVENGGLIKAQKIGEAIGRLKERYPRVARYYRIGYDAAHQQFRYEVDAEKYDRAEKLDGTYLLRTERTDLGAAEVWRLYILLTRAEDAFRDMKSPLSERPIFHHLERRVETHIFLCVLAYHLLVAVENTLLDQGVHTSWHTVRQILETHQVCTVVLPTDRGAVLRIRRGSTPEPEHRQLYKLLGVPLEVMRPQRSWSEPGDETEL